MMPTRRALALLAVLLLSVSAVIAAGEDFGFVAVPIVKPPQKTTTEKGPTAKSGHDAHDENGEHHHGHAGEPTIKEDPEVVALLRREKRSTYVSILVDGTCSASLSEVHEVNGYPSHEGVHELPATLPKGARVEDVCPFDAHGSHGTLGLRQEFREMTWMVSYVHPDTGARLGRVFLDPRVRVGESRFGPAPPVDAADDDVSLHHQATTKDGTIPIVHHIHEHPDIHFVRVPVGVREIEVSCRNTSAMMRMSLAKEKRQRFFGAESASNADYKFDAVSATGPPETQTNVIFLAAGFLPNQEDMFNTIVDRIKDGMDSTRTSGAGYDDMHASVPFDRYWPFYNVFRVFQASNEPGATRALRGESVDNNLKCYHPSTLERAISCNMQLSQALAAVTPAPVKEDPDRCVIVVIVNTYLYGGSALYVKGQIHIGHFYRGFTGSVTDTNAKGEDEGYDALKFNSLVKHELAHAFGNLFDEYDIGITERRAFPLLNCEAPQTVRNPKWSDWIAIRNNASWPQYAIGSQPEFTVADTPVAVCGYSNYYKPTSRCMLQAVRDYFMCPVCRDGGTATILESGLSYGWPRFPRPSARLYIVRSSSDATVSVEGSTVTVASLGRAVLYLPRAVAPTNDFDVTWTWRNGNGPQSYTIPAGSRVSSLPITSLRMTGIGDNQPVDFTATVTDRTNFMTERRRASMASMLRQEYTFTVVIVAAPPTIAGNYSVIEISSSTGSLDVGRIQGNEFPIIEYCNSSECDIQFSSSPYVQPPTVDAIIGEFDSWVLYMQGGLAVFFILLWIWAYIYYKGKSDAVVRPIFKLPFTGIVRLIRWVMTFAAVMFMISSICALGISGWYYTQTSSLGKIIIILGTMLSVGLYLMAFVGFWAVSYRAKKLVIVNGVVLYLGLTILVVCNALAISIGTQINDKRSYWNRNLERFWTGLVEDDPERACAIQGMLECSGFYIACNTIVQSTDHCPIDCDANNRQFGTACQELIAQYVSDNYNAVIYVIGSCVALMLFAVIFNFIYFVGLAKLKRDVSRENEARVHRQASKKKKSMKQADQCKALLILSSLDTGDMHHLMKEFNRIDTDGNGELDRQEFLNFFRKALCYKPSNQEIDEIFRVADLDGDGTISMEEFLCLFDKDAAGAAFAAPAPSKKGKSRKASPMRRTLDPMREAELRRRAARVFGDDSMSGDVNMPPAVPQQEHGERGATSASAEKPKPKQPYRPPTNARPVDPEGLL